MRRDGQLTTLVDDQHYCSLQSKVDDTDDEGGGDDADSKRAVEIVTCAQRRWRRAVAAARDDTRRVEADAKNWLVVEGRRPPRNDGVATTTIVAAVLKTKGRQTQGLCHFFYTCMFFHYNSRDARPLHRRRARRGLGAWHAGFRPHNFLQA